MTGRSTAIARDGQVHGPSRNIAEYQAAAGWHLISNAYLSRVYSLITLTESMILTARRAEYDYYQKGRELSAERFVDIPDEVIRVTLTAARKLVEKVEPTPPSNRVAELAAALPARVSYRHRVQAEAKTMIPIAEIPERWPVHRRNERERKERPMETHPLDAAGKLECGVDPPLLRHRNRLLDKVLTAFHHACDQSNIVVAWELLNTMEFMVMRNPNLPRGGKDLRGPECLVAAHERLWQIRHRDAD